MAAVAKSPMAAATAVRRTAESRAKRDRIRSVPWAAGFPASTIGAVSTHSNRRHPHPIVTTKRSFVTHTDIRISYRYRD
jgi:hypothetical protein